MTPQKFLIRQAIFKDFKRLLEFYESHRSLVLPMESAKAVGDAIENGRVLIVTPWNGAEIVASGAVFQLTPNASLTVVSELAGMRTTGRVGGAEPISVQQMLIGLRLLGHAANEPGTLMRGATHSIIAAVHKDNAESIANLERMGLRPYEEAHPDWLRYNQIGWYNSAADATWRYYLADNASCMRSLNVLDGVGLFTKIIKLHRQNNKTGAIENFDFHLELPELQRAAEDLKAIQAGRERVDLVPPPPLVFPDDDDAE